MELYKREKTLETIGVIIGICMIIVGILFIVFPAETASNSYVLESASFGGDFYTYIYDVTKEAAESAAVTARNIEYLGRRIAQYVGASFIFAGLLTTVNFIQKIVLCKIKMEQNAKKSSTDQEIPERETPEIYSDNN